MATISRLLKITGLFCRIQSLLYGSFAKETYNFKEPTIVATPHPLATPLLGVSACRSLPLCLAPLDEVMGWLWLVGSLEL